MSNLTNSVRLTGFLGTAPEIKLTANDKKIARISLATHGYRRDGNNDVVKTTDWHQLVLWEKQAELAEKYLDKGSEIAIEGRLSNRYYTDKEGTKRFVTEVVVSEIHLFGKRQSA